MKVLAIVGSMAGKKSHTAQLCGMLYERLNTELFHGEGTYECFTLDQVKIDICCSCNRCFRTGECVRRAADDLHVLEDKMLAADIIMVGSPVYGGTISGVLKNFLDRLIVWCHEMRLAGRIVLPVITADSNHVPDTQRFLEGYMRFMGGIIPTTMFAYTGMAQPSMNDEKEMAVPLAECTAKVSAALANRTKFITREQRSTFLYLWSKNRFALMMKQKSGISLSGEADEWGKTGLPKAGSFERYCWEHYSHAIGETCVESESYFHPEMVGWTEERQHYQCLNDLVKGVERGLWLMPLSDVLSAEAKKELAIAYAHRLEQIMLITLESRLQRQIGKKNFAVLLAPQSVKKEERVEAAAAILAELKENRKALWHQFPRLLKLVRFSQEHFVNFVVEFLNAFHEKQVEIERTLFARRRCTKILHLQCDAGDSHNHGRVTMIVETDAGKCVYKPHDLSIDVHMHDFLQKHFSEVTGSPAAVCCGEVGFCEFIENTPAATKEEAKTYYRNLGGLSAVLYLFGATDFHEENMLVSDLKPMPIDLETIMNPEYVNENQQKDMGFLSTLATSLIKSGMGPMRLGSREISPLHDTDEGNHSAPLVDGKKETVAGYVDEMLQGFRKTYQYILDHKEEIIVDFKVMEHDKLRVVARATQAYCTLLFKTYQPGWLKKKDITEDVHKALANSKVLGHSEDLDRQAAAETEAICRGDVPYFCLEAGGHSLLGEGRTVVEKYCTLSALEAVEAHFKRMNRADMDFQSEVLKAMCRKAVLMANDEQEEKAGSVPISLDKAQLVAEAERLFEAVCADGLRYTDGKLYWLGIEEKKRTAMLAMMEGLIDGNSGLGVFFAALSKLTEKDDVKEKAMNLAEQQLANLQRAVPGMEKILEELKKNEPKQEPPALDVGLGRGVAGTLAGLYLIGHYLGKLDKVLPDCQKMLQVIIKYPWAEGKNGLADGRAGLLRVLCRYEELGQLPEAAPLANQIVDTLLKEQTATDREVSGVKLWENGTLKRPLSGFSRGQAGIAAALTLAGEKLGRKDALEAADQVLRFEDSLYLEKKNAWPSLTDSRYSQKPAYGLDGGAAGMGLALLSCHGELAGKNLERAITAVERQGLLYTDSIAQGNAIAAEFLLLIGERKGDPAYTARAIVLLTAMIERAKQQGMYHYLTAEYQQLFLPTFLDGATGIGYTLLRAAAPEEVMSIFV